MTGRLSETIAEWAQDASGMAADAAVTVMARVPILAGCAVLPSAAGLAEWEQAMSEKFAAAWEGGVAAMSGWNAMLVNALFAVPTPTGFAQDSVALLRAVAVPAQARVRANAERLAAPVRI